MLVRPLQPANALFPISVTLSGIVYSVKSLGANAFNTPSMTKQRLSADANLPLNSFRLQQPLNTSVSIVVTLSGIVMLVRLRQPENASSLISVTLLPIVTLVRLLQPWNAPCPMLVTLLGMVMLVRLLQPENASSLISVTLSGITNSVISLPSTNRCLLPWILLFMSSPVICAVKSFLFT